MWKKGLYASTVFVAPPMPGKPWPEEHLRYLRTAPMVAAVSRGPEEAFGYFAPMDAKQLKEVESQAARLRQATGKPVMVAEWGVYQSLKRTADKGAVFDTVLSQLKARPAVKALVYFDTPADDAGDRNISVNSSASALAAFKKIAADPYFNVSLK